MSDAKEKVGGVGKVFGWIKAMVTGVLGLCSGAIIMYASPWVEKAIKPARPVANFGVQVDGLRVTFVNQAEGHEGWWDFGDGSPLQPFTADQKTFTHEYNKAGAYTTRLQLRNLIGEENQREVNVHIDGTTAKPPAIDVFEVQPLDPGRQAPATFRINTRISSAELCVWACGGDHPLEVVADPPDLQERYITFAKAGQYTIKLAAAQGKQVVEKSVTVDVQPAVVSSALAVVRVMNQALQVKTKQTNQWVQVKLPDKVQGAVHRFSKEVLPDIGFQFVAAKFSQPTLPPYIQNAKLEPSDAGGKLILTGEFLPGKLKGDPKTTTPQWVPPVQVTQQSKGKSVPKMSDAVVMQLKVPGVTVVPLPKLPSDWKLEKRQVQLELRDGNQLAWKNASLPKQAPVNLYGQPWLVSATEMNDELRIEVQQSKSGGVPLPPPVKLGKP